MSPKLSKVGEMEDCHLSIGFHLLLVEVFLWEYETPSHPPTIELCCALAKHAASEKTEVHSRKGCCQLKLSLLIQSHPLQLYLKSELGWDNIILDFEGAWDTDTISFYWQWNLLKSLVSRILLCKTGKIIETLGKKNKKEELKGSR